MSNVISLAAFRAAKVAQEHPPVAYPPQQLEPIEPVCVTGYSFGLNPRDLNDLEEVLRKLRCAMEPGYDHHADPEDLYDLAEDLEKINPWSWHPGEVYDEMLAAAKKPQPLLHLMKVVEKYTGVKFPREGYNPAEDF